jgi:hypothetical protein
MNIEDSFYPLGYTNTQLLLAMREANITDFDKGFYMTAQEYAEWVELFCGKPEETEEGVQEL